MEQHCTDIGVAVEGHTLRNSGGSEVPKKNSFDIFIEI